jgi:hypothetical protein
MEIVGEDEERHPQFEARGGESGVDACRWLARDRTVSNAMAGLKFIGALNLE